MRCVKRLALSDKSFEADMVMEGDVSAMQEAIVESRGRAQKNMFVACLFGKATLFVKFHDINIGAGGFR